MICSISQLCLIATLAAGTVAVEFSILNGLLCIRSEFVKRHPEARSHRECAFLCESTQHCQAFSLADSPCDLFVFNKCSKYVRDCSCSRRGQVFVRQQPGLASGVLCPAGYADDFCGTKYKLFGGITNWTIAKAAIDAQSAGLVIMADVTDSSELAHVMNMSLTYNWPFLMLGGYQLPGSVEPGGGWYWVGCNDSISNSLWLSGEPNNVDGTENIATTKTEVTKLCDGNENWGVYVGALAECVSPFD